MYKPGPHSNLHTGQQLSKQQTYYPMMANQGKPEILILFLPTLSGDKEVREDIIPLLPLSFDCMI